MRLKVHSFVKKKIFTLTNIFTKFKPFLKLSLLRQMFPLFTLCLKDYMNMSKNSILSYNSKLIISIYQFNIPTYNSIYLASHVQREIFNLVKTKGI